MFVPSIQITPSTDIQWAPCYDGQQCARLLLPLDYYSNGSSNATTAIAMRMIPARDRANYRGAVLVNQGGPGYSGTAFIGSFGSNLSATVGDSFDVLGFDPRGVGESTPRLDCFQTQSDRDNWNTQEGNQLLNASDESLLNWYVARAQVVGALCATASAQQGDIARFMDTGSVATDMLNIVEKLGQEKLQYWGFVSRLPSQQISPAVAYADTPSSPSSELRYRPRAILRCHVPRQDRPYDP